MRNPAGSSGSRAKKGAILLGEQGWLDVGRTCLQAGIGAKEGRKKEGEVTGSKVRRQYKENTRGNVL